MDTPAGLNLHTPHHWHAESQPYASAHILLRYLYLGWQPDAPADMTRVYFNSQRYVNVYRFLLVRGDEQIEMLVLSSPTIGRLLKEWQPVQVYEMVSRKSQVLAYFGFQDMTDNHWYMTDGDCERRPA